ncbi:MAG: TonB-dependent receptor [Lentimicrobiaceae bacterium]|jgi:outer membrane cobalamin receptor|nr:TonB-dependent receptor [Lentimicrobiaceae bacterium]MDD4598949.1 TonB-dependent receptor [Lentimicrobiaceae bacterium]MDY0026721.1 TonB-dependent receptor [Lentimicrobium sp.]
MKLLSLTGFLCGMIALQLQAQEPVSDTLQLKGIEVKTRKISRAETSVNPLQILNIAQINTVAGNSVAEAVKTFSGVSLRDYGGIGGLKTVMIRSLGANHTGVFVDGMPVSDIASGQIDLGKLPLDGLEEISLSIGTSATQPFPARAFASAGMINLRSIQPNFEHQKTHGNFRLKAGSFGLINPTANLSRKTGEKSWIEITASWLKSDGDYPYIVDNGSAGTQALNRNNSDITALSAHARYFIHLSDSANFHAKIRLYNSDRGLPGAVVFYNPQSAQRLTNKDFVLNLQYQTKNHHVSTLGSAGWSRAWLRYVDPYYLGQEKPLDNRYLQNEFYVSQAVDITFGKFLSASTAADGVVNTFSSNLYDNRNPLRLSLLASGNLRYKRKITETSTGFLLCLIRDKNDSGYQKDLAKFTPFASFSLRMLNEPSLRFRLMYKQSFRMPTFNDLYYNIVGNLNLKPENVHQLNAGLLFSIARNNQFAISGRADLFINQVNNKIIAVPTQNLFVWSMRNIGQVQTKGIELQLDQHSEISKNLTLNLSVNFTYQQALDVSNESLSSYRQQIPYIPLETFSGMASIRYHAVSLNYSLLFNGFRYISAANTWENMLPGWWVSDVSLSWEKKATKLSYQVKAEATNLFNEQYVVIKSFPMPGRSFALALGLNF